MKKKISCILLLGFIIGSCKHESKRPPTNIWVQKKLFNYSVTLPSSYVIRKMQDSSLKITNGNVSMFFNAGYYEIGAIKNQIDVLSEGKTGSFKKRILYGSEEKNKTSFLMSLWDTAHAIDLFRTIQYRGCVFSVKNVNENQRDTIVKIFKSVRPIAPVKTIPIP